MENKNPWQCPVCGKFIHITGTTLDGRLIGSCNDAFTLEFFMQETSDFLKRRITDLLEDAVDDPTGYDEEWAHLSRATVEIGMGPLQPLEVAVGMARRSTGVFQLKSFDQIRD